MELNVKLPDLMELLCKTTDITDQYNDGSYPLNDQSEGVRYLFHQFLRPIIHEGIYAVDDIDLDRFDREELEELWDIYKDRFGPHSDTWQTASRIYSVCSDAPSLAHAVTFI